MPCPVEWARAETGQLTEERLAEETPRALARQGQINKNEFYLPSLGYPLPVFKTPLSKERRVRCLPLPPRDCSVCVCADYVTVILSAQMKLG